MDAEFVTLSERIQDPFVEAASGVVGQWGRFIRK
jgi:hypothetical protein